MFKKRIRKDAGEITIQDLQEFPSWEFCLDEEGEEGQTECTLRPFKPTTKTLSPNENCLVAADFECKSGKRFVGWFNLGSGDFNVPWTLSPELFLPKDTIRLSGNERLFVDCPGAVRVNLWLPSKHVVTQEELKPHLDFLFETLGLVMDDLFPLVVTPRHRIRGWPESFLVNQLDRPPGDDIRTGKKRIHDSAPCPHCGEPLMSPLAKQCLSCGADWH